MEPLPHGARDRNEQPVTALVSAAVVHLLEVIEIDDQYAATRGVAREVGVQEAGESPPVEQTREHVVFGQEPELLLVAARLGDVHHLGEDPPRHVAHRRHDHGGEDDVEDLAVAMHQPALRPVRLEWPLRS